MSVIDTIFGNYTKNNKKKVLSDVEKVNSYKTRFENITHSQKKIKVKIKPQDEVVVMTEEEYQFYLWSYHFKKQLREGKTTKDIMPEAIALAREATRRKTGKFQYDVQVEAACAMQDNVITEMKTGEGKTLVQILSAYVASLEATCSKNMKEWKSVHVMTSNDYLAKRDATDNKSIFDLLGMSSSFVAEKKGNDDLKTYKQEKQKAYACDIVYGTTKTIAFDYLNDNLVTKKEDKFMKKGLSKAILDEADDILFDQAITPLVISSKTKDSKEYDKQNNDLYKRATDFLYGEAPLNNKKLSIKIFEQYERDKSKEYTEDIVVFLDEQKIIFSEKLYNRIYAGNPDLNNPDVQYEYSVFENALENCVKAEVLFKEKKQYIIENNKKDGTKNIVLIDQNTGRVMPSTKYRNGMQQAIEQKEIRKHPDYNFNLSSTSRTIAKCTYPDFLSLYENGISGMTGTSDEKEFESIYGIPTYIVPTRKPNIRIDHDIEVYNTLDNKCKAILKEVLAAKKTGQPVLIGTTNINESDMINSYLDRAGIRVQRLDAVNKENEDGIKKTAGMRGMVTIATNMAGRGIDINLGEGVEELGGLYVIGTSQNKNLRIDNQLRGRSARQGQPGKTKYFASLEDEIVKTGLNINLNALKSCGDKTTGRINNKKVINIVKDCQEKEENKAKNARYVSEQYESAAFSKHKKEMYRQRDIVLNASPKELAELLKGIINSYTEEIVSDKDEVEVKLGHLIDNKKAYSTNKQTYENNIKSQLGEKIGKAYHAYIPTKKNPNYSEAIRDKWLNVIDRYWENHMMDLENLRISVSIHQNEDPLKVYEREAAKMFNDMSNYIKNELITYALNPSIQKGTYVVKEKPIINIEEEGRKL